MQLPSALHPPTRVSRLYPLLTLVLMIGSSSLVYAWQNSQLSGDTAVKDRDRQITELKRQVDQLTSDSKKDKATLLSQQTQISQDSSQLADLEKQLGDKTAALKDAQSQLTNQQSQLDANSTELAKLRTRPPLFSFQNQSALTDVATKEADIKQIVTDAYDYIQNLYGAPYLLNSITITFVNTFTIPGASGEILITNGPSGISIDIHLKDFDKNNFDDVNTIIHEIVHGFHGIAVLDSSALEEGMAVAATDAVMKQMTADKKLQDFGHLYLIITPDQYTYYNGKLTVHADSATFYSDPQISRVYQLLGIAWYKLWQADPNFFHDFNEAYYAKVQKGQTVDVTAVQDIIASTVQSVAGTPIHTYLSQNRAFNPTNP